MLVTHRGPYRFSVRDDGSFASRRGAGGLVSALLPLVQRDDIGERPSWVAAAIDDGDRAAVAAGAATVPGLDLRMLALDPALHRMHYDVISNAVLWFLHHGLFDLARRPRFDRHLHEAWDGYVAVNAAFADVVAASAPEGEQVLVHDYHLALVPGHGARGPARPAPHPLHPHAVLRPQLHPRAPHRDGRGHVRVDGRGDRGIPHRTLGRGLHRVGARGPRSRRHAGLRRAPRTRSRRPGRARGERRHRTSGRRARRAGRRPQAPVAQRSHRSLQEHRARLPRVRRVPRRAPRVRANVSCSSPCSTGRVPTWPSTSRTSRRSTRPRRASTSGGRRATGSQWWSTPATTTSRPSPGSPGTTRSW